MPFYMKLRYMLRKTKEIENLEKELEKEKGVKGVRGVRGVRDTLREIDEKFSENKNTN